MHVEPFPKVCQPATGGVDAATMHDKRRGQSVGLISDEAMWTKVNLEISEHISNYS